LKKMSTTTTPSRAAAAAFHRPTFIKKKKHQKFAPRKAAPAFSAHALKKRAQLRGIGLVTQSELDDGGNSSLGKATTSAAEVGDDSDDDDEKSSSRGASLSSRERLRQALNEEIDGAMREVSRAQTEEERRPAAAAAAAAVAPEIKQMRFEEEEDFYPLEEERPPRTRRGLEELERRERERRATRTTTTTRRRRPSSSAREGEEMTTTRERRVRNDASSSSSSGGRRKSKQQPINNNNSSDVFTLTRSQLMGKEVVTRTSGVRLGQCSQMWVDAENWTVEALAIRQNALTGGVDHVKLSALRQVGDVVLVHDENAVERRWSSYNLSPLIGCDVITEAGAFIGRVRDYEFDPEDGSVKRLIVDAWGISAIPDDVISTYAVDVREVIDAGRERILVEDGCEQRVEQLSVSLLQRLELAGTPWEEEEAFLQDPYYNNESSRRGVGRRTTSYYDEYEEEEMIRYEQRRRRQREQQQQQSRRREPQRQQQRERRKEGIPLMRPTQSYERMDADGKRGSRPQFDAYLDPVDRPYEYEEISGAPRERRASASRRLDEPSSSSSSSRRRRPASDDYL
jgi:sporulation protein YlmC with PRC-barrel domain